MSANQSKQDIVDAIVESEDVFIDEVHSDRITVAGSSVLPLDIGRMIDEHPDVRDIQEGSMRFAVTGLGNQSGVDLGKRAGGSDAGEESTGGNGCDEARLQVERVLKSASRQGFLDQNELDQALTNAENMGCIEDEEALDALRQADNILMSETGVGLGVVLDIVRRAFTGQAVGKLPATAHDLQQRSHSIRNFEPEDFHQAAIVSGKADAREQLARVESGRFEPMLAAGHKFFRALDPDERRAFADSNPGLMDWISTWGFLEDLVQFPEYVDNTVDSEQSRLDGGNG